MKHTHTQSHHTFTHTHIHTCTKRTYVMNCVLFSTVFVSRGKMATHHLLACPKIHVDHLDDPLVTEDMLVHLRAMGLKALHKVTASELPLDVFASSRRVKFAFHAPGSNSIDHLHMHAFFLPHSSLWAQIIYATSRSWCVSDVDAIARVRAREFKENAV